MFEVEADRQNARAASEQAGKESGAELEHEREQDKTRFTSQGPLPPVSADGAGERKSASELAEERGRLGGIWGGLLDGAASLLGDAFEKAPEVKAANGLFSGLFGGDDKPRNLTIQSKTMFKAPGGAKSDRTTIGVGEGIDLEGSAAGTWSASGGNLFGGQNSKDAFWRAPDRAGEQTITLDVGGTKVTKTFHVVEPDTMHYKFRSSAYIDPFTAGAGMMMNMDLTSKAADVSFGNVEVKEVPHEAQSQDGYFRQPGAKEFRANHTPNPAFTTVLPNNTLLGTDKADMEIAPLPPTSARPKGGFVPGKVVWKIPHNFKTIDQKGEKKFADVFQTLEVIDDKGTCRVTKDGHSVTRGIEDDVSTWDQAPKDGATQDPSKK